MTSMQDIEVGRYALRTFKVDMVRRTLGSVVRNVVWDGGVCVAECLATAYSTKAHCAESPTEGCSCGVYGAVSLESLRAQYYEKASLSVAVIAAEGMTIIGDRGLRTAAARVVAYWCSPELAEVYAEVCPTARRFDDALAMAEAYGMPCEHGKAVSLGLARVYDQGERSVAARILACRGCGRETLDTPVIVEKVKGVYEVPTLDQVRADAEAKGLLIPVTGNAVLYEQMARMQKIINELTSQVFSPREVRDLLG